MSVRFFDEVKVPHGEVHIVKDRCKGCGFCVEYCPMGVLELSNEFNVKGYHPPISHDGLSCISCRLCEMICPEFAIFVTVKDEEKETVEIWQ